MAQRRINILRSVSRVTHETLGDAELLRRFVGSRDSAAFEVLVWRHGPAIYSACRRMLRDRHLAEDALQATFLLLSQKAATIRDGKQLAGWLHRTACRVCWRAAKTQRPETLDKEPLAPSPVGLEPDVAAILDAEVNRLPERFRMVVVLCYLENRSTDEAAQMLNIPRGTVLSRLATARAKLGVRLTKQGLAPTLGVVLLSNTLSAELVQRCVTIGCHTGLALATVPFQLAQGVIAMNLQKLVLAWSMVFVSIAGVGTGVAVVATAGDEPGKVTVVKPRIQPNPKPATTKAEASEQSGKESRDPLEGTWKLTKVILNGGTGSLFRKGLMRLADGQVDFQMTPDSLVQPEGEKTSVNKKPILLRYTANNGSDPSELTFYGDGDYRPMIYRLEQDILTTAIYTTNDQKRRSTNRPTSFSHKDAPAGESLVLHIHERIDDSPSITTKRKPSEANSGNANRSDIDRDHLQGLWKQTHFTIDGEEEVNSKATPVRLSFLGEKVQIVDGVNRGDIFDYIVQTNTNPSTMIWRNSKHLISGIYNLNEDTLVIAHNMNKKLPPPTSFKAEPGSQLIVATYEREKSLVQADEPEVKKSEPNARETLEADLARSEKLLAAITEAEEAYNLQLTKNSSILVDSKKAALVAVEEELVKAEVKLVEAEINYAEYKDRRDVPDEIQRRMQIPTKIVEFLRERREKLHKELIASTVRTIEENQVRSDLTNLHSQKQTLQAEIQDIRFKLGAIK